VFELDFLAEIIIERTYLNISVENINTITGFLPENNRRSVFKSCCRKTKHNGRFSVGKLLVVRSEKNFFSKKKVSNLAKTF